MRNKALSGLGILAVFLTGGDRPSPSHSYSTVAPIQEAELAPSATQNVSPLAPHDIQMGEAPKTLAADVEAEKAIRDLFLRGDFATADQLARMQLASGTISGEYKTWLRSQLPMIKLGWAWSLIRQKNCEEALPLLESTQDQSAQYLALKGIGYCLLQKKDFAAAGSYLERFLEKNKSDPEAYILLAEAKESMGEANEALALAQEANALQNLTDEEIRELKKREESLNVKAEESAGQTEMSSGFIRLRYQGVKHQAMASPAIQVMQRTVETLNLLLNLSYPAEPIEVIFHQSENFGKIAHGPSWTAGLYDGRVRIPVSEGQEVDEDFARILRHEITHAVLSEHAQHRKLPTWFQEGLAQVAECPELCWHFNFASTQFPFLSASAFDAGFINLNRGDAQVAYKQSFYLLQTLNWQFGGVTNIKQIIDEIPQIQELSSDSLLYTIRQNFAALHQKAQENWQAQRSF